MNLTIRNLENQIIELINNAGLPIEVCRLVLSEVYGKVDKEATNIILEEMNQPVTEEGELDAESTQRGEE